MRLALAQTNPTIGALDDNAALILAFARRAHEQQADLVVFPELCLTGYPPKDLLMQEGFIDAACIAAKRVGEALPPGITVVFGAPMPLDETGRRLSNALLVYRDGQMVAWYDKRLLPTYDVFDENRYFVAGTRPVVVSVPMRSARGGAGRNVPVGLSICEDLWRGFDAGFSERYLDKPDPVEELCNPAPESGLARPELIVNPSASPFVLGKGERHRAILAHHARERGIVLAAVNQVGGNDELVFDGYAAVVGADGEVMAEGRLFEEGLLVVDVALEGTEGRREEGTQAPRHEDTKEGRNPLRSPVATTSPRGGGVGAKTCDEELLFRALVLGVRDYCRKTGFKSCVLGLSGGIDSAVVAVLAAAALGPENVLGVSMPSRYSSEGSKDDAAVLAKNLGVPFQTLPIEGAFALLLGVLEPAMGGKGADVTEENLQSRVRGTLLMAISNKHNHLLLTTGNKSELGVGYCTLYGDMNGGLAVLSDVGKIMVYRLARWMNEHAGDLGVAGLARPPIPEASITKAPSAELRPNQTDQDSLPPYHVLDEIIERYVERRESPARIVREMGADAAVVARVVRMIDLAEYKRKQAPVGLKVTGVAFGSGRRMPIAQGWRPGV
ncbi:MAG: NAD+ synthase [Phycisphaerales bacterium]